MRTAFDHVLDHINDLAVCRDAARRIVRVNGAFVRTFGGTAEAWRGRCFDGAESGAQIGAFHNNRAYGHVRTASGTSYWIEWDEAPLPDGGSIAIGRLNRDRRMGPRRPSAPGRERRRNKTVIRVPAVKSEAPPAHLAAPEPQSAAQQAPLHVLLVEDDPLSAKLATALLEHENCQVTRVEDGADAVELARQRTFDMVFMDMRLPVMNGPEACRAMRALGGAWSRIPIIALTANAFEDDRKACLAAGMTGFITKPIDARTLQEARQRWTADGKAAKLA